MAEFKEKIIRFLRWSERYTKTDMVYLASGASFSVIGQGAGLVAAFILAIAVGHFVPKEVYGTYKFIQSVVNILVLFSLTGISGAVFQSAAQGYDGALRKGFWQNIKWSILVFVLGLVVAGYYVLNGNTTIAIGILIGASLSPFIASASLFGPFLGGKKDFRRQMIYGVVDNVIPIAIFIGVVSLTSDPVVLVATYFVTNALAALFFYNRTVTIYHATLNKQDTEFGTYSKHLSALGIIGGIADRIDQILLFHYVGAAQLAVYNFAIAIPDQVRGPVKNLSSMIQAQFAIRPTTEIRQGLWHKAFLLFLLALVVTGVYVLAAPYIFTIFFPKYAEAIQFSRIYALWILTIPLDPFTTYLSAKKKTGRLYAIYIFASVTQVASMLIGVIFWGLIGLILARVIARLIMGIAGYFLYRGAIAQEGTA